MDYYAHTIRISNFRMRDLDNIEKILKSGYLLSRRKLRQNGDRSIETSVFSMLFNGMDYISLCDLKMNHDGNSAYNVYTKRGLSLLLDHSLPVIRPTILEPNSYNYFDVKLFLGKKRFTDLIDEVQVKDSISLNYLKGLCLSMTAFSFFYNEDYINNYLDDLCQLLKDYDYDVPIYNLDTKEKIKIK